MNADQHSPKPTALLHGELTEQVLRSFYNVYNALGYGFLEKVYENALLFDLQESGFLVEQQRPIKVVYRNRVVGDYFADLCVENKIIVELKSVEKLKPGHMAQLFNYLKATEFEVGLLLNFGPKPEFERKVSQNKNPR
jgi:GxxExxY protein